MSKEIELQEKKLTLQPARVDLLGIKTQMVFAAIFTLVFIFNIWSKSNNSGFLLDDFLHFDYVSRALKGDYHDFLSNFYNNWAGSDIMLSYRPLSSLSLFLDCFIWHKNAWGYHLSNLLMLSICSFFLGLISIELTGLRGNRLAAVAGIWSALLFAAYPLHPEASAWIIGRVDLLCSMFCYISVWGYLRFKLLRESFYFKLSLLSFVAAVLCKEMAITLPLIITALEFLLYPNENKKLKPEFKNSAKIQRLTAVLSFWFLLGFLASWRFFVLGTLVGGYGDKNPFLAFTNFFNKDSILKIIFPLNDDLIARQSAWQLEKLLTKILSITYLGIIISFIWRVIKGNINYRILCFLIIWIFVALLPSSQIWHISPNLVGSRLFFMSSGPFVILLVFLALPVLDTISKKQAKLVTIFGTTLLLIVFLIWSYILNFNLESWKQAGNLTNKFRQEISQEIIQLPKNKKILLLDIPTDYSGSGMISRPQYLSFLFKEPFSEKNLAEKIICLEPKLTGSHDFIWPETFYNITKSSEIATIFRWQNNNLEKFALPNNLTDIKNIEIFQLPSLETWNLSLLSDQNQKTKAIEESKENDWHIKAYKNFEIYKKDKELIFNTKNEGVKIISTLTNFSPSINKAFILKLGYSIEGQTPKEPAAITWQDNLRTNNYCYEFMLAQNTEKKNAIEQYIWLGRLKSWLFCNGISSFALKFPAGNYKIRVSEINFIPQNQIVPELNWSDRKNRIISYSYKVSNDLEANKLKLLILGPNSSFEANTSNEIDSLLTSNSNKLFKEIDLPTVSVSNKDPIAKNIYYQIPKSLFQNKGYYQLRIYVCNKNNKLINFASEPIDLEINKETRLD